MTRALRALVTTTAFGAHALLAGCTESLEVLAKGPSGRPSSGHEAGVRSDAIDSGTFDLDGGFARQDGETPEPTPDAERAPLLPDPDLLYRFDEGAGTRVLDTSSAGTLYHLTIATPSRVTWLADALRIDQPTILSSSGPATELAQACKQSRGVTLEAWVVPAEAAADGTRRIISMSNGTRERNFLLGQGGLEDDGPLDSFSMRLRTSTTNDNGIPILSSATNTATTTLTHVVAVHAPNGKEQIFVNGVESQQSTRAGNFDNWDDTLQIHVGNEQAAPDDTRAFLGEIHLVAAYCTPLSALEIAELFTLGASR